MGFLKILGQFSLFGAVVGGLFFVFDAEAAGGILALFALLAVQARFILSKVRLKATTRPKVVAAPDLPELDPQRVAGVLKSLAQAQKTKVSNENTPTVAPTKTSQKKPRTEDPATKAQNLDSNVFSQFKQNLATSQESLEKPKTLIVADDDVVLDLSVKPKSSAGANTPSKPTVAAGATGYNPYAKGGAKPKVSQTKTDTAPTKDQVKELQPKQEQTPAKSVPSNLETPSSITEEMPKAVIGDSKLDQISVAPIGSLFEELEAESLAPTVNQVQPKARKKQADIQPLEETKVTEPEKKGILSPLKSHEMLKESDLLPPEPDGAQTELLVKMTKKAIREERFAQALTSIQAFFESSEEKEVAMVRQVLEMKAQAFFGLEDYHSHQTTIEELLKNHYKKGTKGYLKQLEKVMDRFIKAEKPALALPYLLTALVEYGKADDQKRLDVAYYHIESAYRALNEPENLITTLQNHLGVKANLESKEDQLPLLDQLGKLLFDAGDQEGSRKCYEQVVEIQKVMAN
ncbi:MAG: hypothetical protein QNL04_01500 [SAR324 cluster bacterium]|nr:hypothetical protein [SAR324 cluster bacterium]